MLDWSKYIKVANRFQYKAKREDREDLNHSIIVALADAQGSMDGNGGGQLSDIAMLRLSSYQCQKYWRAVKRNSRIVSLNTMVTDGNGDGIELIETLADDKAIDLSGWLDAKTWLYQCPDRLVKVAYKKVAGYPLTNAERAYLSRHRQKAQKSLVLV